MANGAQTPTPMANKWLLNTLFVLRSNTKTHLFLFESIYMIAQKLPIGQNMS